MIDEDEDAERQLDLYLAIHTLRGMITKPTTAGVLIRITWSAWIGSRANATVRASRQDQSSIPI
jgi:hypothetical protein